MERKEDVNKYRKVWKLQILFDHKIGDIFLVCNRVVCVCVCVCARVCVCMCVSMSVCVSACRCVCRCITKCVRVCARAHVCLSVCVCVRVCIRAYVWVDMFKCARMCFCVYVCVPERKCVYVCAWAPTLFLIETVLHQRVSQNERVHLPKFWPYGGERRKPRLVCASDLIERFRKVYFEGWRWLCVCLATLWRKPDPLPQIIDRLFVGYLKGKT